MAKKRAAKAVADAEENKVNEALRRKAGKVSLTFNSLLLYLIWNTIKDVSEAREELKKKEAEKDAIRRRQEKINDAKAKAAVKAQIEADKRERAERARREKEARTGGINIEGDTSVASGAKSVAAAAALGSGATGKSHENTRLQVTLVARFVESLLMVDDRFDLNREESHMSPPCLRNLVSMLSTSHIGNVMTLVALMDVAEFLAGQVLTVDVETVNFAMHFPR
jgi:UBX domain-containing protein 1/4